MAITTINRQTKKTIILTNITKKGFHEFAYKNENEYDENKRFKCKQ